MLDDSQQNLVNNLFLLLTSGQVPSKKLKQRLNQMKKQELFNYTDCKTQAFESNQVEFLMRNTKKEEELMTQYVI